MTKLGLADLQETLAPLQPYLLLILAILVAILLVSLFMRLSMGRIVFWIAQRRYLTNQLRQMMDGWSDERDRQSMDAVAQFANSRLSNRLAASYKLADDARAVLLLVQQRQRPKNKNAQVAYRFSLLQLVQCSLLAFCDLKRELYERRWFRIVGRLRLGRVLRMIRPAGSKDRQLHHRFINWLRKMKLVFSIPIVLLTPVLAPPFFLFYVSRVIVRATLYEGLVRYIYGLFLLRFGYYAIYLYSRKNTVIAERLAAIPTNQLDELACEFERQLNPATWAPHSTVFESALNRYRSLLADFELPPDPICVSGAARSERMFGRAFAVLRKVARKKAFRHQPVDDTHQLFRLCRELGHVYAPSDSRPFLRFRLGELLDLGYIATVLALHRATSIPGGRRLLDNVSLDIALKISDVRGNNDALSFGRFLAGMYRKASAARKAKQLVGAAAGLTFPVGFAVSLVGDVALQQLTDHYRAFVYHRAGRLVLFGFEQNTLGRRTPWARLLVPPK